MSYIQFKEQPKPATRVTRIWRVETLNGASLGEISYFARWRAYTFYPCARTTFDASCLKDIATFLEEANKQRKEERAS